jgi:hypothetical protein
MFHFSAKRAESHAGPVLILKNRGKGFGTIAFKGQQAVSTQDLLQISIGTTQRFKTI